MSPASIFLFFWYIVEDFEKILNEEDKCSLAPSVKLREKVSYLGHFYRTIFLFRITSILLFFKINLLLNYIYIYVYN